MSLLTRHGPDSPLAWVEGRTITAAELVAHVEGFAALLEPAREGEEIAVICRDRYRFTVAMLACWERGYAIALPPNAQVDTLRALRPSVATVIHDVDGVDRGIDVRDEGVVSAARRRVGQVSFRPLAALAPDRHLATIYTSGSTGAHAACPKTSAQLIGEAIALTETFGIRPAARIAPMVPPHHIYGLLFGVLVPLVSGASFARRTPLHVGEVREVLGAGVDALVTVPAHLHGLLLAEPGELPRVPRVFSSGAPLSPRLAAQVRERLSWSVTEVFGSTETGGIGHRETGGEGPWTPLPGVVVGVGEGDRLLLDSPFVHPKEPRPYLGADRIEVFPDGRFAHLGRADGVLKIGGVRVSIAEIERRLLAIEGVRDAAVIAKGVDGPRGHEIWAVVVAPGLDARAIRASLSAWLAPVAMPRRLRLVERLPRNAAGKLPRRELEALFVEATDG